MSLRRPSQRHAKAGLEDNLLGRVSRTKQLNVRWQRESILYFALLFLISRVMKMVLLRAVQVDSFSGESQHRVKVSTEEGRFRFRWARPSLPLLKLLQHVHP